ncbi:MAG: DUF2935 domain-containing protein [Tyzzerella sp.]|nr:DUF2935 domain-containing protein [Tyzzerella sp.]
MRDYVRISLETHLFFARIMKEHAMFLQAGFVQKDSEWIQKADYYRTEFEDLHRRTVEMSNRMISGSVLRSDEMVTDYTMDAENKTCELSGLPIDTRITSAQQELKCGRDFVVTREMMQRVYRLNEKAVSLLNGLIDFKERLLREVKECRMYTTNYPLLIDHIMREAKLYRDTVEGLMRNQRVNYRSLQNQEEFWNCIMMEHALFIRGLLDPCEEELIGTADDLARDFKELIEKARKQDYRANTAYTNNTYGNNTCGNSTYANNTCGNNCMTDDYSDRMTEMTLEKTKELRDFKAAGTRGLLNCQVKSIILPLLADHVLREANHYIRILENGYKWMEG